MYLDHEGNRTVEVNQTRNSTPHYRGAVHAKVPGGGRYECRFHASQKHEDPGRGKTTRAPPGDQTTEVARQHDTGRPQGDQKFRRIEPRTWRAHTLSRAVSCKIYSINQT